MPRPQRPSADLTRQKILNAARQLFLECGYSGASMQQIANTAKVNQNLIFHHFQNKLNLWHNVKHMIINECDVAPEYNTNSAKEFITSIIQYRFSLYGNHPDLVQLMRWQQFESNGDTISGFNVASPKAWKKWLRHFQKQGTIKLNINVDVIITFISVSISGIFMQNVLRLNKRELAEYQRVIINSAFYFLVPATIQEKT